MTKRIVILFILLVYRLVLTNVPAFHYDHFIFITWFNIIVRKWAKYLLRDFLTNLVVPCFQSFFNDFAGILYLYCRQARTYFSIGEIHV